MNQPEPTPEAVEAATCFIDGRGRVHWNNAACFLLSIATDEDHESGCPQTHAAARILAAEVRRLRGEAHTAEHGLFCPGCGRKVRIKTSQNP